MPRNKLGGKGAKKSKNYVPASRKLMFKDEECQEYAKVISIQGGCFMKCICEDSKTRLCHIRGKMRKRVWVTTGDIVIISLRDFQDDKADIIHKYNANEVRKLKNFGKINFIHSYGNDDIVNNSMSSSDEEEEEEENWRNKSVNNVTSNGNNSSYFNMDEMVENSSEEDDEYNLKDL